MIPASGTTGTDCDKLSLLYTNIRVYADVTALSLVLGLNPYWVSGYSRRLAWNGEEMKLLVLPWIGKHDVMLIIQPT